MKKPVIVVGTGGHAKVLIEILRLNKVRILGATDIDMERAISCLCGVNVIGNDDALAAAYSPGEVTLVNGVGSVRVTPRRGEIFERFQSQGYRFESVIHPAAIVSPNVVLSEGVQIMAGAIVQSGSRIGANTIINSNAVIEHECEIQSHVHIASGATLCGGVRVGNYAHIGAGATLIQQLQIGENALIAAGAVVTKNIAANVMVAGVPAREIKV